MLSKHGYGINIQAQQIFPDSAEKMWELIDMAPKYAATELIRSAREELDPNANYAAHTLLEWICPDCAYIALANVLAEVIKEREGIELVVAMDAADSDNVILAFPLGSSVPDGWNNLRRGINMFMKKYMGVITKWFYPPEYITWFEHEPPKREFVVETPIGKLKIYAKHEGTDSPADYPGVWIDFIDPTTGNAIPLSCVEYDPNGGDHGGSIYTRVYGDALSEEPTESVYHENLSGYDLALAKKLIRDFCNAEYGEGEDDFENLERVPLAYTTADNESLGIQVYADLINPGIITCLVPNGNEVVVSENRYKTLGEFCDNELECLSADDVLHITQEEWMRFAASEEGQAWLRQEYPIGTAIRSFVWNKWHHGVVAAYKSNGFMVVKFEGVDNTTDILYGYDNIEIKEEK